MKSIRKVVAFLLAIMLMLPATVMGQSDVSNTSNLLDTTEKTLERLENDESFRDNLTNNLEELEKSEPEEEEVRVIVETKDNPAIYYNNSSEEGISQNAINQAVVIDDNTNSILEVAKDSGLLVKTLSTYNTVFSGFSAIVKTEDVETLENLPGVKKVWISEKYTRVPTDKPDMSFTHEIIENRSVWTDLGYKGEGTVVSVIDSGIDHTHKDMKLTNTNRAKLSETEVNSIISANPEMKGAFKTDKVPYGYNYFDNSSETLDLGFDPSMHGQHVAGTVGANGDPNAPLGESVQGVAPETQLLAMKVFGNEAIYSTTYTDIYIRAIEDSIKLKADAINMSLGSPAGNVLKDDPLTKAVENAEKAGIQFSISSGNSSHSIWGLAHVLNALDYPFAMDPDYGVVGSPSVTSESISVASYENVAMTASAIKFSVNSQEKTYPYISSSPVSPIGVTGEVVDLGTGKQEEFDKYLEENGQDSLKDKVVVIQRGQNFVETQARSQASGAALHILYNDAARGDALVRMATNPGQTIPSLFVSHQAGLDLLQSDAGSLRVTDDMTKTANPSYGLMSDFTSRGPSPVLEMKPEISAPGGQIYSTLNSDKYGIMSGTSMAAPHVAGGIALLRQYIDSDVKFKDVSSLATKGDLVKALLMNSADILRHPETDVPYAVRTQGAGGMNIRKAVHTPMLVTKANTLDAKVELKSLSSKTFSFDLELTNLTDRELTYNVDVEMVKDRLGSLNGEVYNTLGTSKLNGSVDQDKVVLAPKEKTIKTFTVQVLDNNIKDQFVDGWVKFSSELESDVVLPFFGFYGDFNSVRALDKLRFGEGVGQNGPAYNYLGKLPLPGLFIQNSSGGISFNSDEKAAITPGTLEGLILGQGQTFPVLTYLRNLQSIRTSIVDENDKQVTLLNVKENTRKNYYNRGQGTRYTFERPSTWNGTARGKIVKDGKYFYKFESLPFLAMDPQVTKIPVYVDTSRPVIESALVQSTRHLDVKATDETTGINGFLVTVTPYDKDKALEAKTERVTALELPAPVDNTYSIDISEMLEGIGDDSLGNVTVEVVAFDHAMNLSSVEVKANNTKSQDIPYLYVISPDILDMGNKPSAKLDGYVIDTNPVDVSYSVNDGDEVKVNTTFATGLKVSYTDPDTTYQSGWKFNGTVALHEGYNLVKVFARSQSDSSKEQVVSREVWVDTIKPVVELVDYQKTAEVNSMAKVTIKVDEQLEEFTVLDKNGELVSKHSKAYTFRNVSDVSVEHSFEVPVYEEGPYTVELKVVDAVGNETALAPFVINEVVVDKSELEALVTKANNLDKSVFTEESVSALNAAVEEAQAVLDNENATQEEVNAAVEKLNTALAGLVEVEVVNKDALKAKVDELAELDRSKYTEESLAKLDAAVEKANEVLANENAKQVDVDLALQELQAAQDALVEKEVVDTTALETLVAEVEALDKSVYTEESVFKLNSALTKAKEVLESEEKTQSEVDLAHKELQEAKDALVEKPQVDTAALEKLVAEVEAMDKSAYSDESVLALESALAKAKEVLADSNATQEDVDNAHKELQTAKSNLEEKLVVDTSRLEQLVTEAEAVDSAKYTDSSVNALNKALEKAKAVLAKDSKTQVEVDLASLELELALLKLDEKPTEEPVDPKVSGWVKEDGKWYYLNPTTFEPETGWKKDGNYWYYLDPTTGAMKTGWEKVSDQWYYLAPGSGRMLTGWVKLSGSWYYLAPGSGRMLTGWQKINDVWYYMRPGSGVMHTGWLKLGNAWYYLDPTTGAMKTGYYYVGSARHYSNSSGVWVRQVN